MLGPPMSALAVSPAVSRHDQERRWGEFLQFVGDDPEAAPLDKGHEDVDPVGREDLLFEFARGEGSVQIPIDIQDAISVYHK
jgi:hypothetical protein